MTVFLEGQLSCVLGGCDNDVLEILENCLFVDRSAELVKIKFNYAKHDDFLDNIMLQNNINTEI